MSSAANTAAQRAAAARLPWPQRAFVHPAARTVVALLAALPAAWLLQRAFADQLGPNPAEALIRGLGDWALRLLLATLAISPLRRLAGWPTLLRLRRPLGQAAFGYALLHLAAYVAFDQGFDFAAVARDIAKRPFILVGMLSFALMLPLAATSTDAMVRRLGGLRWRWLHRLVYVVAPLALLHFFWMRAGKNDFGEWTWYAATLALLFGERLWRLRPPPGARGACH